ncbi:MAG: protein S100 [Betaproteobacteria bacterium]
MAVAQLHPRYLHFKELPLSLRFLYTAVLCVLGLGYLFALIYLFHTYAGKDGNPNSLSYEDMVIAYSGTGKDSKLESALRGSMSVMLPREELTNIIGWVQKGTDKAAFEKDVRPILEKRCLGCHDGSNPHLPALTNYDNVKKVTEKDTGTEVFTLVRVSHIHLFGITFIFFLLGTIFSHAYLRPVWFKCSIMALPFVALVVDVASWYVTKIYHPFAWVVMAGGGVTGLCFAVMWFTSMWQMWIGKMPEPVASRAMRAADATYVG